MSPSSSRLLLDNILLYGLAADISRQLQVLMKINAEFFNNCMPVFLGTEFRKLGLTDWRRIRPDWNTLITCL